MATSWRHRSSLRLHVASGRASTSIGTPPGSHSKRMGRLGWILGGWVPINPTCQGGIGADTLGSHHDPARKESSGVTRPAARGEETGAQACSCRWTNAMDPCGRRGTRSEDELRDRRWDRRVETRRCTQGKEKDLEGIRADEHRTRQCRKAMKTNAKAISAVLLVLLVAFFQAGKAYDDYYDDYGGGAKAPKKIAGVVDLDEITFDKIVDGSHNVFVSFVDGDSTAADDEDDEGDDEDSTDSDDDSSSDFSTELETLAEKFGKHNGVILARVDASDAFDITEKFDVNSYPTLMLFQKGEKTPERYEGVLNADKIEAFLGSKVGFPAVVEELEGIVKKFKSDESSRDKTLKEAREVVEGLDEEKKKLGEYYLKVMEKVMKKGNDHVSKEARRLSSIIEKGSALQDKITEMKQRLDILRSFHKDEL